MRFSLSAAACFGLILSLQLCQVAGDEAPESDVDVKLILRRTSESTPQKLPTGSEKLILKERDRGTPVDLDPIDSKLILKRDTKKELPTAGGKLILARRPREKTQAAKSSGSAEKWLSHEMTKLQKSLLVHEKAINSTILMCSPTVLATTINDQLSEMVGLSISTIQRIKHVQTAGLVSSSDEIEYQEAAAKQLALFQYYLFLAIRGIKDMESNVFGLDGVFDSALSDANLVAKTVRESAIALGGAGVVGFLEQSSTAPSSLISGLLKKQSEDRHSLSSKQLVSVVSLVAL